MVFVYSLGKYLYLRGLLLLIVEAIGESLLPYLGSGSAHWPNPLPLFLYLSLLLLGHDRYRRLVSTALLASSAISLLALLWISVTLGVHRDELLLPLLLLLNGLIEGYVGWKIVLHGFVRFYLLGLRMDDKMRQSETGEDVRNELKALSEALPQSTQPTSGVG